MTLRLRHRLRAAWSRRRVAAVSTPSNSRPETYEEWALRTTREYRELADGFWSTFNIARVENTDYTREEKIALTIKTLGIDYDQNRVAANRAQRLAPPRHAAPMCNKVMVQADTGKQRRSDTVRLRAGRSLLHVTVCAYCGESGSESHGPDGKLWHLDHVHPLSKGGADATHNIVKACAYCNLSKGNRFRTPKAGTLRADGVVLS